MRATRIALISLIAVVGFGGIAAAQYEAYTPIIDEEAGVPQRCSIEWSGMMGKDRRKNDMAYTIRGIVDSTTSPYATAYFTIAGQRLGRSVAVLKIVQASIDTGTVKMAGTVVKPSETGSYAIGSTGEETLKLPLAMASGSTVTYTEEDEDPVTLTLPAASEKTRAALFSCYQRATRLPESVRPEMPGAATMPTEGQ